ncbi:MAG TPA: DUF1854 domain-containing protein [Firmicutes bacterium]|nr:DUF1854 domain-containing protein [Bacillota bacterium]
MYVPDLKFLPEEDLRFFTSPGGILRLSTPQCTYLAVQVRLAFPLTHKDQYVTVHDAADEYIGMIKDPHKLDETSRTLVAQALAARYYVPKVTQIRSTKEDLGIVYWEVDTDFGPKEFVVRDPRGSLIAIDEGCFLLQDVNENRYLVNYHELDRQSRNRLERIL